MSAITNLTALKDMIRNYSHRKDLDSLFNFFIELAETRINRSLRVAEMEKRSTTSATDSFVELPADFLELRNIQLGDRVPANFKSLQQLDINRNSTEIMYSITGNHLEIRPDIQSDDPIDVEINYYAKVPSVILDPADMSTSPEYKVFQNYPMLYLYACMLEIALYIQDDNRIDIWEKKFNQEIEFNNESSQKGLYSGSVATIGGT